MGWGECRLTGMGEASTQLQQDAPQRAEHVLGDSCPPNVHLSLQQRNFDTSCSHLAQCVRSHTRAQNPHMPPPPAPSPQPSELIGLSSQPARPLL